MTVFYFMIYDKRASQITYIPKFTISLTPVYPLFRTFGKCCPGRTYMPKSNYALVEESGFFSSNTKGQGYLAGKIFKNTL